MLLFRNRNSVYLIKRNFSYIKFKSVEGNKLTPYDEPQELHHYYKYTYDLNIPLDYANYAQKYGVYPSKYVQEEFYKWDNQTKADISEYYG